MRWMVAPQGAVVCNRCYNKGKGKPTCEACGDGLWNPEVAVGFTRCCVCQRYDARIAKAISPCRRSGMPRCVAMPATIQRRRGAPVLVGSVKSRCRRTRNRPGVMSVGKGGDQRAVDEAGLEAPLPKLPLCIWCGAALDGGPSSDAGRPCVCSTAERPSTGRCLKVSTHRPSCV